MLHGVSRTTPPGIERLLNGNYSIEVEHDLADNRELLGKVGYLRFNATRSIYQLTLDISYKCGGEYLIINYIIHPRYTIVEIDPITFHG